MIDKLKIQYIHGFGSQYDTQSLKIRTLETIGGIFGFDYDYTESIHHLTQIMGQQILDHQPDLLIGTSLGGYYAARLGSEYGVPFVALNPSIEPRRTLKRYQGHGKDWLGKPYYLAPEEIDLYPPISKGGCGLVLLESGDEIIDAHESFRYLEDAYRVILFNKGDHRFSDRTLQDCLNMIEDFHFNASLIYGLSDAD